MYFILSKNKFAIKIQMKIIYNCGIENDTIVLKVIWGLDRFNPWPVLYNSDASHTLLTILSYEAA